MRKLLTLLTALILSFSLVLPASAAGRVSYRGNAEGFLFSPGSTHSPTDLFPRLKSVMPGDRLEQTITVKNDAENDVKVEIYLRSLGAKAGSEDFLSRLHLQVEKSEENEMAYMFDGAASETGSLADWVFLGTLYSGGTVDLDLILTVPTSLSNEYQDQIGYLDWEFMVKEFPVEEDDPVAPGTGDSTQMWLWSGLACVSATALFFLIVILRKNKQKN